MAEQPMLERIARVLCEQELRDPDAVCIGEGKAVGRTWLGWHAFISSARQVLTAMRMPTPAILEILGEDGENDAEAADRWRALIDVEMTSSECRAVELS